MNAPSLTIIIPIQDIIFSIRGMWETDGRLFILEHGHAIRREWRARDSFAVSARQ